ncbi:MAG: transporter substrate-binding protein [Paenibacillus sp.]|jgi:multiple sugar transport system substrate-binding protein|nr:transporter substrate-binding protein [Paenibacillus sp.]
MDGEFGQATGIRLTCEHETTMPAMRTKTREVFFVKKRSKWFVTSLVAIACAVALAGCSGGGSGDQTDAAKDKAPSAAAPSVVDTAPKAPITLKVILSGVVLTDDEFQTLFVDPVKKKYPYITLTMVKGATIQNLMAQGDIPDLFILNTRSFAIFGNLKITEDLNGIIQQNKFDLNQFEQNAMKTIMTLGDGKQIFGIPFYQNRYAMYYNKDIFDKFGTAYPKDGMTWDQTIELGKKLTRQEGGIQYKGLAPSCCANDTRDFPSGFGLAYVNPKTLKAEVNTDGWKKALTILKDIITIPGNDGADRLKFANDKNVAMMVSANPRLGELEEVNKKGQGVNYDLAGAPYFPEFPGKTQETDIRILSMSSTSKHKDDVFRAIQTVVASDNQTLFVRKGFPPVLKDDKLKPQFGDELVTLKGKHKEAFFLMEPTLSPVRTKYVNDANSIVSAQFARMLKNEMDVNTALREAEEKINQLVAAGEH